MATKPQVPMCVVNVHHLDLLLPMKQGMELVTILQKAARVDREWTDRGAVYTVRSDEIINVDLTLVQPNQVRMPHAEVWPAAASPRAIGTEPLKLTRER